MLDAIVVGSGPGGVICARGLRGERVLVLDVGNRPGPLPGLDGNLYELRRSREDLFEQLIGAGFEGLRNLRGRAVSLKLKSPGMAYVIRDGERLAPVLSEGFEATISLAEGGLANAWGAGVYRFTDEDLAGFPIRAADLEPHYDELTRLIGISGESDDLDPWFGGAAGLLPPLRLSGIAADVSARYRRHLPEFRRRGIVVGRPRLAVLTREHRGRPAYRHDNLEFFKPHDPSIYNPAFTLREMVSAGEVAYRPGVLVTRFAEHADRVEVSARDLAAGGEETFVARRLFLAAGALNSARIVLASAGDHASRLPLLDNPVTLVPLLSPGRIGAALDPNDSSLGQLNIIVQPGAGDGETLQGTLYGTTGPLRSDALFELPAPVPAAVCLAKYLAPAMAVVMLFHPDRPDPGNFLQLAPSGALRLRHAPPRPGSGARRLVAAFRRIGLLGADVLCRQAPIGSGLHYAGTLPMKAAPGRYETGVDGRLGGSARVFVVDGACVPTLPAKNLTFTIMANAARIAALARGGRP
ncbi:MAG TPA: GMC oxidoreductase [bacterium]